MRSRASIVGLVALAAAFGAGCALSHEAAFDAGNDDAQVEFDSPRRDVVPGEVVAHPDVITARDSGCGAGMMLCSAGGCVDVSSDPSNCGACGTRCPLATGGTATCSAGTCGLSCAGGYHSCGAACVTDTSTTQCGSSCMTCMPVLNANVACSGGACTHTCLPGFVDNGASCELPVPSTCGDRMLESGETCDDGNRLAGDGCSSSCQMEPGTSAEDCTASITAIRISDSGTHLYVGTTNGAANDNGGIGTCTGNGPDVAYQIVFSLPSTYSYTVTATPLSAWDVVLQHGTACPPGYCVDSNSAGAAESYSISATTPLTANVLVDGWHTSDHGDFVLRIDVP